MRLALCQMNATVGDIAGNAARIRDGMQAASDAGAELVLFPELALTGYPPEDLLLKEHFLAAAAATLRELAAQAQGIVAVVGFPERAEDVYNSAAVLADGTVHAIYRKVYLPNYGVFDEQRYFQAGHSGAVIDLAGEIVGVTVCEDIWEPGPPASEEAHAGATLILNISASPYHAGKGAERELMFAQRARDNLACVAFCGLVGGQDELVFDGHSCVVDHTGATIARAAQFREELLVCDVDLAAAAAARLRDPSQRPAVRRSERRATVLPALGASAVATAAQSGAKGAPASGMTGEPPASAARTPASGATGEPPASAARKPASATSGGALTALLEPVEAEIYAALMLGLHDYVRKNGFEHVVLGLSGGIDSALVACIAADALGCERVSAAIMPSPYSSTDTQDDARALAAALGLRTHELTIEPIMKSYEHALASDFHGHAPDITEENLQARIRGNLLMALSNKFGWLVLATGNKSEMSVGYTTLYGDLAGGFAVIKDVPKTLVYRLCTWRNSPDGARAPDAIAPPALQHEQPARDATPAGALQPIPLTIIQRPPTAELRHDQRDEDSLPPYPVLDRILEGYVELDQSREQLIAQGLPVADVERTIRLVDHAEYKRRQAPPGIKITTRAFGRDRRMPITNRYRG
jgi:NAD+ synthase (glutamine-hydrolysing)